MNLLANVSSYQVATTTNQISSIQFLHIGASLALFSQIGPYLFKEKGLKGRHLSRDFGICSLLRARPYLRSPKMTVLRGSSSFEPQRIVRSHLLDSLVECKNRVFLNAVCILQYLMWSSVYQCEGA